MAPGRTDQVTETSAANGKPGSSVLPLCGRVNLRCLASNCDDDRSSLTVAMDGALVRGAGSLLKLRQGGVGSPDAVLHKASLGELV